MTDHLALWNAVSKTPPGETKAITGKPYSGTSPKPFYLVKKATETFGPCGIGWGFDIVSERIEDAAPGDKLHIARVRVWYKWNGERGEVEHVGQTPLSGTRSSGKTYTDEDAPKKSVTDALVKALSMIGFAGDIFMGRYDDSKYVAELKAEERIAAAPAPANDEPTESERLIVAAAKTAIDQAATLPDLKVWWASPETQAALKHLPDALRTAVEEHKENRKAALTADLRMAG